MTDYQEYHSFAEKLMAMSTRNPESRMCQNYAKAAAIIEELLHTAETDIDPEENCPYDLVCRHANVARRALTYITDAIISPDNDEPPRPTVREVRVFTNLDNHGGPHGPQV